MNNPTHRELVLRAREMRKNPTAAEAALWQAVRKRKLGERFRRQHVMYPWILDFFCKACELAVEVDGDVHELLAHQDATRDSWLARRNVRVLRLDNELVLDNLPEALRQIRAAMNERLDACFGAS